MKICWFGTYNSDWGRSQIYMQGLRMARVEILECQSVAKGIYKYLELFRKHKEISGQYEAMVVGYPGHAVVWFAKLISPKPVIFDALCTMYEGVVLSRGSKGFLGLKSLYVRFVDWLAVRCADVVLVESEAQKKYFEQRFGQSAKYRVVYTGANDAVFHPDLNVIKNEQFTVLFRGKFLPEAGIEYIIESAKILEGQGVNFLIIGNGWQEKLIKAQVENYKLKNLELITENLPNGDLVGRMNECHVSLGQFADHERLERTIPHKCFESLAIGLPYLTAQMNGVAEILKDGESSFFCRPADAQDLADKILYLKNNPTVAKRIGERGRVVYEERFTPFKLAQNILEIISHK